MSEGKDMSDVFAVPTFSGKWLMVEKRDDLWVVSRPGWNWDEAVHDRFLEHMGNVCPTRAEYTRLRTAEEPKEYSWFEKARPTDGSLRFDSDGERVLWNGFPGELVHQVWAKYTVFSEPGPDTPVVPESVQSEAAAPDPWEWEYRRLESYLGAWLRVSCGRFEAAMAEWVETRKGAL